MAGKPDALVVEVEFTPSAWTDVSAYVRLVDGMDIKRGRSNPYDPCETGSLTLTLDNPDGRFTPGSAIITDPTTGAVSANPLYPYVRENVQIRVTATHDALDYSLFTGTVDSYSMTFLDGYGTWNLVAVAASDAFKTLGRRQLRTVYEEVARKAGASNFWPLAVSDPDTIPVDLSDAISTLGTGRVVAPVSNPYAVQAYSNDEKPQQLAGSLGFSGSVGSGNGQGAGVAAFADPGWPVDSVVSTVVWFKVPAGAVDQTLFDSPYSFMVVDASGYFAWPAAVTSTTLVNDGRWYCGMTVCQFSAGGTTIDISVYLDGLGLGSASGSGTHFAPFTWWVLNGNIENVLSTVPFNPTKAADSNDASYAGLIISPTDLGASAADLFSAARNNIAGESVDDRAARILDWCGIAPAGYDIATDMAAVIGPQDTLGKSALEALQELAAAEGAPMFIDGAGLVVFQSRDHRATFTPVATFDAAADLAGDSISLTLADEGIINQVTATVTGGASATVYVNDLLSEYLTATLSSSPLSPIEDTIEAPWSTVDQARDAAYRRLVEKSQARLRFPQITIDPSTASTDIWSTALATEISDLVRVTGLNPATCGGSSQRDLFVESIGWHFGADVMTLTLDTTALDRGLGWMRFDDTTTGRWGHVTNVMTVGTVGCLSGTGTGTFTCATADGPLWTTAPADFPLTVKVHEEEMTVSGISGASSPQTFTVSARGVNGTVATAHATGSYVQLYPIPVFAQ